MWFTSVIRREVCVLYLVCVCVCLIGFLPLVKLKARATKVL